MTTKNLIPRASGEGGIGITDVTWGYGYYDTGNFNKGLFVSGHNITQVIAETVTQGGLGGEWTRNGLDIYYNGGNVGIGVTNPSQKLDIHGKFTVNGDGTALWGNIPNGITGRLSWDGGATGKIILRAEANNTLNLGANGSHNHIVIDTNGNVGIGTTNPGSKLEVAEDNSENCSIRLRSNSQNGTILGALTELKSIGTNSTYGTDFTISNRDASDSFKERIRLVYNGNVGIGTTSPVTKLHVAGVGRFDVPEGGRSLLSWSVGATTAQNQPVFALVTNEINNADRVIFNSDGDSWFNGGNVGIGTTNPGSVLVVQGKQGYEDSASNLLTSTTKSALQVKGSNNGTESLFMGVETVNANPYIQGSTSSGNNAKDILINPFGGNVGIGTTNPGTLLHIHQKNADEYATILLRTTTKSLGIGVGGTTAILPGLRDKFYIYDNTPGAGARLVVDSAGNVGIGTTNPVGKFQVKGGTSYLEGISLLPSSGLASEINSGSGTYDIQFKRGAFDTMIIDSNGNVGIGTTNPPAKLTVATDNAPGGYAMMVSAGGGGAEDGGIYISAGRTAPTSAGDCVYLGFRDGDGTSSGGVRCSSSPSSPEFFSGSDVRMKKNIEDCDINGIEKIKSLKPDVVITQAQCEVCAVSEKDVELALGDLLAHQSQLISLMPNTLSDILREIMEVAVTLGVEKRGEGLIEDLQERIDIVKHKLKFFPDKPTVAIIEWLSPIMVAGNWIPELVQIAGGNSILAENGKHSPFVEWQQIYDENPEVLIIAPCGFSINRTLQEIDLILNLPGWRDLNAVKNNKVYIADGNAYFNRSGPRIVDTIEMLAEMITPKYFAFGYEGDGWIKFES